ncbi:MAG: hypothetical protein WBZ36_08485 [Candidatus Nitrosopolaris sp.]
MSSISIPLLLFGSFLFILIIFSSLGSSVISFMFLRGQTEELKSAPPDKSITFKLTASTARVITTSESKTAVHNIAASNSDSFHSHSSINSVNTSKFAKSVIPQANLTKTSSASKSRYNDNSDKTLSISIQSSQKIVNGRGTSTVTAIAYDGSTGKQIENAVVIMKITFASNNTSKEVVGRDGHVTFSVQIEPNSKDSGNISFKSTVLASAPGYISTSKAISSYSSTSLSHHEEKQFITNKNGSGELALNILKDVQKKLEQNGIRFALGK